MGYFLSKICRRALSILLVVSSVYCSEGAAPGGAHAVMHGLQALVASYGQAICSAPHAIAQACRAARLKMHQIPLRLREQLGKEVLNSALERSACYVREHPFKVALYCVGPVIIYTIVVVVITRQIMHRLKRQKQSMPSQT